MKKTAIHRASVTFWMGIALMVLTCEARAALGQLPTKLAVKSVATAQPAGAVSAQRAQANKSVPQTLGYSTQESLLENGTLIREFADSDGIVFAIQWQGPVLPDLQLLMGKYFDIFKLQAEEMRQSGRRSSVVSFSRDGLVMQSSGRQRSFSGFAYAVSSVPVGLEIKNVLQ